MLNALGNCEVNFRGLATLGLIVLSHLVLPSYANGTSRRTLSGCVRGDGCSQCPEAHYKKMEDGSLMCCPSCAPATLYHGDYPSDWCVCRMDGDKKVASPRTITFPDQPQAQRDPVTLSSRGESGKVIVSPGPGTNTQYILNPGDRVGSSSSVTSVPSGIQQALSLLADTVESLHARISRLEEILLSNQDQRGSESVDRVGVVTQESTLQQQHSSCTNTNFTRVGQRCYYSSATHDYRTVWQDARTACTAMGAKLAEPLTRAEFIDLTQHMALMSTSTGFSYWLGGLYPGVSWLWAYAGEKVPLNSMYWTGEDAAGNRVNPGDTTHGRCLAFSYLIRAASYFFAADECGFEKFFMCELLEQGA
ncbi:hypothetical protein Pcinc_004515 [Petrolisthes cinctipes]|uniref:C-type lectin domain-containing protein n=1 Tax=Petrolisthes cinctipes TaxID=88211 RepID=A0AAE1GED8_PETCI|nr:hypothetical protein Pcinc_004515 [Petrolisthes cinctipes]